jgi:predicted dehydrogenase
MTTPPTRVAVTGTHGYGLAHLASVAQLEQAGLARLVAVADPVPPEPGTVPEHTQVFGQLADLLAATQVDVVTVATPIHTHLPLATAAIEAGADVLLEKPPVPSMAAFAELSALAAARGRIVQIGFQSLASTALGHINEVIGSGRIGAVRSIGSTGTWLRRASYWHRSAWAGRRSLDGVDVVDGVVTNPLSHGIATALRIAGACRRDDVAEVSVDLYRANDIEADDTSTVRVRPTAGPPVTAAFTLCAPVQTEPVVTVHGETGRLDFFYTSDVLEIWVDGARTPERLEFTRTDLLANLLAHRRDPAVPLFAPLADTESFIAVVDAVRAGTVHPIAPEHVEWRDEGADRHPVLADVEHWVAEADRQAALFREIGAPWAQD